MQSRVTVEGWWKGEIERGPVEIEILNCPPRSMTCAGLVHGHAWP